MYDYFLVFGVDSNDTIDDFDNLSSIWKASTHEIFTFTKSSMDKNVQKIIV